ncbi:hypothetical protein Pla22_52500 [Rubripirellula amarantea]|uniref:Uncharacterized protein n=1 Tax=Rubripirellula amarantea TaxID=2527999 RepID=A0A5C5W8Y8_9BACT|nr:hypothetical protein Pla22_52500 [Rubripirellula amarantea]
MCRSFASLCQTSTRPVNPDVIPLKCSIARDLCGFHQFWPDQFSACVICHPLQRVASLHLLAARMVDRLRFSLTPKVAGTGRDARVGDSTFSTLLAAPSTTYCNRRRRFYGHADRLSPAIAERRGLIRRCTALIARTCLRLFFRWHAFLRCHPTETPRTSRLGSLPTSLRHPNRDVLGVSSPLRFRFHARPMLNLLMPHAARYTRSMPAASRRCLAHARRLLTPREGITMGCTGAGLAGVF